MKKLIRLIVVLSVAAISSSYAAFTVNLDAGLIKGFNGADTMVSDNTLGSPNGSLLLLIDEGPNNAISNTLAPGQFVSGDDIVLAAGGFNSNGGHDETLTSFTNITLGTTGDLIALRWFPNITLAQYLASTTPTAGQTFGTYNPLAAGNATNNPDGGNPWAVPGPGSTVALNFFTTDDPLGGTQIPSTGYADFVVGSAVPEPSILALLGIGVVGLPFLSRRQKSLS